MLHQPISTGLLGAKTWKMNNSSKSRRLGRTGSELMKNGGRAPWSNCQVWCGEISINLQWPLFYVNVAGGHWEEWMCRQGPDTWDTSWINDLCIMGNLKPAVSNTESSNPTVKTLRPPDPSAILICIKRPLWQMAGHPWVTSQRCKNRRQWAHNLFHATMSVPV